MHGLMIFLWVWIMGALSITGVYCHAQDSEKVTPADLFVCFFLWPIVLGLIILYTIKKED